VRFERRNGGLEVVALDVADRVFGDVPDVFDRVVIRRVRWEFHQMHILQRVALGEFRADEFVLVLRGVVRHDHDLLPRIQSDQGLDRFQGGGAVLPTHTTELRLPFTNNGSEQDVRLLKIQMKVSGGLRMMAGARDFLDLRSYLSTARKQGQSACAVLRQLHGGDSWLLSAAC
jgi:hypothetical protein